MNNEKISFAVENVELIDTKKESNFSILSLDFFASGPNEHHLFVSEEVLEKNSGTIKNCPLVWKYSPITRDATTHDANEVPCGFVPESAQITKRKLDDGRTMLNVACFVWKRFSGKIMEVFERDGEKPISVEMRLFDTAERADGMTEMLDYVFEAITVLGNSVRPAIPMARATVLQFSEEYQNAVKKEFSNFDVTFPYKTVADMNPALKGIDPPVSVEQGNKIAKQADAIGSDKGGWGVSISHFKRTHFAKNGKWTKIEKGEDIKTETTKEEEMSVEKDKEFEEKEEMTAETPAEKKAENTNEEEKESPEEGSQNQEEKKEDMSLDMNLDLSAMLSMLEDETEEYAKMSEEAKGGKVNYSKLCNAMYTKMCNMKASLEQMSSQCQSYMSENMSLKEFKAQTEAKEYAFEVEKVLNEVSETMPKEKVDEAREDSKNFSIETVDAFKNKVKAVAFSYVKHNKKDDGIVRMGMPFANSVEITHSIWKR